MGPHLLKNNNNKKIKWDRKLLMFFPFFSVYSLYICEFPLLYSFMGKELLLNLKMEREIPVCPVLVNPSPFHYILVVGISFLILKLICWGLFNIFLASLL